MQFRRSGLRGVRRLVLLGIVVHGAAALSLTGAFMGCASGDEEQPAPTEPGDHDAALDVRAHDAPLSTPDAVGDDAADNDSGDIDADDTDAATPDDATPSTDSDVDAGSDDAADDATDASPVDTGIDTSTPDAGHDAGADTGTDAGHDSGTDAGHDSGVDAGHDSGTDAGSVCGGLNEWVAGTTESHVKHFGEKYTCKVSGWCSDGTPNAVAYYEPGKGLAWSQAWNDDGACQ